MQPHLSHPEIEKRLSRASGHLQKVIQMIQGENSCLEVAQQLQAVTNALVKAKQIYVQDHIEHCIQSAQGENSIVTARKIKELKEITKYL